MALPTVNTNGILITTGASVPLPAAGYVTYFFNSADSNKLYYKADDGTVLQASLDSVACDPCLCETVSKTMCAWNNALQNATITPVEYLTLINANITFTCVTDGVTSSITITTTP